MIFDKNYDKALWLLVASNKEDSEKICRLINYIPEDVYIEIQKAIDNYYNGKLDVGMGNIIFRTTLIDNENYQSAITVKISLDRLYFNIYRSKEDVDRVEEEYELILKDIDNVDIDNMLYFDKKLIGNYSSEINNIKFVGYLTDVDTMNLNRKYYLKRVPLCYVISSYLGRKRLSMKIVNFSKNMPEEIYIDDFSSQEKINSLVKNRKKVKI